MNNLAVRGCADEGHEQHMRGVESNQEDEDNDNCDSCLVQLLAQLNLRSRRSTIIKWLGMSREEIDCSICA